MVAQRVTVDIQDDTVRNAIALLVLTLKTPRAVFDQIGRSLVSATRLRFERETAPDGKPWLKSIRALATGGQTLTDKGTLRRSITHNVTADGQGVEVGSNLVYAAIHQFGGQAGRGLSVTLPARPYLGIDDRDRRNVLRIVRRAIDKAAQASQGAS